MGVKLIHPLAKNTYTFPCQPEEYCKELARYYLTDKLLSAVARVATSYAGASTQQDPNQALQYIRGIWSLAPDDEAIGMEAPVLIKHRDIVMTAVTIILQEICNIPKDRIKEFQKTLWLPPPAEK